MPYRHKRVRRFFTLYFIPMIPLDLHGEYVECQRCRGTYLLDVLNFDPAAGQAEFEAELHRAIKQVMIAMIIADGVVEDEEVETVQNIYAQLTGNEISNEVLRMEISQAQTHVRSVTESLQQLAGTLNDNGKAMVIKAAFLVAAADGEFQEQERALIALIGQTLNMSAEHVNGVINSMLERQ